MTRGEHEPRFDARERQSREDAREAALSDERRGGERRKNRDALGARGDESGFMEAADTQDDRYATTVAASRSPGVKSDRANFVPGGS